MERLKDLRTQAQLSQQELADALGVCRTAVTKWENSNDAYPRPQMLPALASALGCKIDDLFPPPS